MITHVVRHARMAFEEPRYPQALRREPWPMGVCFDGQLL